MNDTFQQIAFASKKTFEKVDYYLHFPKAFC